jgi:ABC-type uncharacterized transport system ATPase subunit
MRVELRSIYKNFGKVQANIGINLDIPSGKIQGILGENGAGKSTLMKILSGFIRADRGEIKLDDKKVDIKSPADAMNYGIGMLHQDPLDFPPMRVIDNFLIGQKGGLVPNRKATTQAFKDLQKKYEFSLDPETYVETLTVGERQQLEILRLLHLGAKVLILDEPTTGISASQKEKLFATLRHLASQGKTIIFVSHKLEDVESLCDKIAVLLRGQLVGDVLPPFNTNYLVELMFGKIITLADHQPCTPGECIVELKKVNIEDNRLQITDVNLQVCAGEVIGVAGMEGSGQALLLRTLAGIIRPVSGNVYVRGEDMTGKNYRSYLDRGVTFMPASRLEEGLIPGMTIHEHVMLAERKKGLFIQANKAREEAQLRIKDFSIHGTPFTRVDTLSGGNQQRTLLALLRKPLRLLLLEHPTRGLDIESTIYIWDKLKERCRQGTAIFFISPDLEEILQYSDRILVFFNGRVSPALDAETTSIDLLGQLIGGKGWDEVFRKESTHVQG